MVNIRIKKCAYQGGSKMPTYAPRRRRGCSAFAAGTAAAAAVVAAEAGLAVGEDGAAAGAADAVFHAGSVDHGEIVAGDKRASEEPYPQMAWTRTTIELAMPSAPPLSAASPAARLQVAGDAAAAAAAAGTAVTHGWTIPDSGLVPSDSEQRG
eukprot:g7108.t1